MSSRQSHDHDRPPSPAPSTPDNPRLSGVDLRRPPPLAVVDPGPLRSPRLAAGQHPLDENTLTLLAAGVPLNTRRAYAAGRRAWSTWAEAVGVPALPPDAVDLARYAAHLLTTGNPTVPDPRPLAASTVEGHLSAVSTWAVEQGHPRASLRAARLVVRGHHRLAGQPRGRRAAPITVDILRALVRQAMTRVHADGSPTARALRDRALILLGFALGTRRSELVALDLQDLTVVPQGLLVAVWRAKTRATTDEVPVPVTGGELCVVQAVATYTAMLAERGLLEGPLFRPVTRTDVVLDRRLSAESVADLITSLAAAADIPVPTGFRGFTAHSLRRGMATEARRAGADPLSVARLGGWADGSGALAAYLVDVDRWADHPLGRLLS